MEIQLTLAQEAFIRQGMEAGRFASPSEAVEQALAAWEERERSYMEFMASLDEAEDDLAEGHFKDYTDDTLSSLVAEVIAEAKAQQA